MKINITLLISLCALSLSATAQEPSPYTGQEGRDVKALSKKQMANYLQGSGMGYAKAAELNHYPGPRHVLDLAAELGLSEEQIDRTNAIFSAMQSRAIELGKQIITLETELDRHFANQRIDLDTLEKLLMETGALEAELRYAHLLAHLEQHAVLTSQQIQQYNKLRGYGHSAHGGHDH